MARKRPAVSRFLVEPLERRALFSVAPLTFTDGDGTLVKITLSGNGSVSLVPAGGKFDVVVANSDQGTRLSFTTKGGDKRASIHDITVSGAMNTVSGAAIDVLGDVSFTGSVRAVTLGSFLPGGAHTLTIGGTSAAKTVAVTLGNVVDLLLESGTPFSSIKVADWQNTGGNNMIEAPLLNRLSSAGDLKTSLRLQNTAVGAGTLGAVSVKGELAGTWFVDGAFPGEGRRVVETFPPATA